MMQRTSKQLAKQKFPHSSAKLLFLETFFINGVVHYLVQCETKEVFLGINNAEFKLIWSGSVKQKISCVCYCDKPKIVYAGTSKGTIAIIDLSQGSAKQCGKIDAINGQHILAMFAYFSEIDNLPYLIAVNVMGILRRYKNNKFQISASLPFTIRRAISNKQIMKNKDIAMVFFKQGGKWPYMFSADYLITLTNAAKSKQEIATQIAQYEKELVYNIDQQIATESIAAVALSSKVLAIAVDRVVTICTLVAQKKLIMAVPHFKFVQDQAIKDLDIIDNSLLVCSGKGMMTFDVEKRKKIARGLVIKGKQYDLAKWAQLPNSLIYGASANPKMKISYCLLTLYGKDQSKSIIS